MHHVLCTAIQCHASLICSYYRGGEGRCKNIILTHCALMNMAAISYIREYIMIFFYMSLNIKAMTLTNSSKRKTKHHQMYSERKTIESVIESECAVCMVEAKLLDSQGQCRYSVELAYH